MAFTVNDIQDLLSILRSKPEWREAVRNEVLGDELLSLPALVRQNSEAIANLTERMEQLTERVDQLTAAVQALVDHSVRVDIDLGELKGDTLQLWYAAHPQVLAQRRRLRKLWLPLVLNLDLVDAAIESGRLSQEQVDSLYNLDLMIGGREGTGADARDAFLVVEVSNTIDAHDLERAGERADLLRSLGYAAYPVVAGRQIASRTQQTADKLGIDVHLRPQRASA